MPGRITPRTTTATCRLTRSLPGRDGGTYSVHPVGLPLLAIPAFALGGYPGVVALMVLFAAAAAALAWRWVRRVTGSVAAATFSWSATALSVPFLTNGGTITRRYQPRSR